MSLGIAFKGPEGIVLAADSRVTIMAMQPPPMLGQPNVLVPATFDNATKLLRIKGQDHVGAVTYGMGAIGQQQPRTAHSFIPEFEAHLATKYSVQDARPGVEKKTSRLTVQEFAKELSSFFGERWKASGMPDKLPPGAPDMVFLIGGFDPDAPYGCVFEFSIPSKPEPHEQLTSQFGLAWGGQREIVDRVLQGYDPRVMDLITNELQLNPNQVQQVRQKLAGINIPIPYQFLPLQDCVDLSIFLLTATIRLQTWMVGIRGVGGAIDVAAITKADGFQPVRVKRLSAEGILPQR